MHLYGYALDDVDAEQPTRLREVTLHADAAALRQVGRFLLDQADAIERGELPPGGHEHLCDAVRGWSVAHPDADVIVVAAGPP